MRLPPWTLLVAGLVLIAGVIVATVALGGDDDGGNANAAANTPTSSPDEWGPDPVFTDHIVGVRPEHRGKVRQADTIENISGRQTGICADVTYQDLPQNNLSFIVALDGEIAVEDTSIVLTRGTLEAPEAGTLCYGGSEPLALGIHAIAVAVQDPNNLSGPPSEIVGWKFEVIE